MNNFESHVTNETELWFTDSRVVISGRWAVCHQSQFSIAATNVFSNTDQSLGNDIARMFNYLLIWQNKLILVSELKPG